MASANHISRMRLIGRFRSYLMKGISAGIPRFTHDILVLIILQRIERIGPLQVEEPHSGITSLSL